MKILLASSSSGSRGGGELYLLYLGEALAQRGHAVTLWCSRNAPMDELAGAFTRFGAVVRSDYPNTYDLPGRSLSSWLSVGRSRRIGAKWAALAPDILHVNKQNLEDGLDLTRAAAFAGLPTLCTIHLTQSARFLRARLAAIRDAISRRALRNFPGPLVAIVEQRGDDLRNFAGPAANVKVIPNGVPIPSLAGRTEARQRMRKRLHVTDAQLLVVAVGRMVPQKRPLDFIALAAGSRTALPDAHFVWIGDGKLSGAWDAAVAEHGAADRVHRIPWAPDVPAWLLASDAFLHVAEYEGLPLALLEAMAAGLPCVVTPELKSELRFLNEGNAIVIDPAGKWRESLRDSAARLRIGTAARALAEREFSCALMAERYERLYASLAGSNTA